MEFLNKMEKKFGRFAIHNLSTYIIALYVAGYLMSVIAPEFLNYLTLEPYYILRGQIWRLLTWVIVPPTTLGFAAIIMLFFYYSVGNLLERTWGAFRYNVYIFSGMAAMVIGAFVLYFALGGRTLFGLAISTYYINMTIFLAFASTYPDTQVMLYFLIPIKMKWLGIVYGALLLSDFLRYNWVMKVIMLVSTLNFLVYFIYTRKNGIKRDFRRWDYNRRNQQGQSSGAGRTFAGGFGKTFADSFGQKNEEPAGKTVKGNGPITRHKCAVCGRTELDGDDLEFRFCSKCNGNYEYCQDHLFTHEHVK